MTLLGAQDFYFTLCSVNINQCLNSTFKYSWTLKKINMKTPAILNILFNSVMNFFCPRVHENRLVSFQTTATKTNM